MKLEMIPDIVVDRLPRYLQTLHKMDAEGKKTTSSQELGAELGISAAQIRKDLSFFGGFGKQGTGYAIAYLVERLQEILKVNQVWDIALVGAGNLGKAIAQYQGFANRGFRVVMIFDNDPAVIGTQVGKFAVQNSAIMVQAIRQAGVKIAMLTVPASAAQRVAEILVEAGVQAILNYSPVALNLSEAIQVEYIDPILQLQHMTYYLNGKS
jgi:redox-sensing transcriptional repressor